MFRRVFSSIPGLSPPDARSTPSPLLPAPIMISKISPDIAKYLWGKNHPQLRTIVPDNESKGQNLLSTRTKCSEITCPHFVTWKAHGVAARFCSQN